MKTNHPSRRLSRVNRYANQHLRDTHRCYRGDVNICKAKVDAMKMIGMPNYVADYVRTNNKLPTIKYLTQVPKIPGDRNTVTKYLNNKMIEAKNSSILSWFNYNNYKILNTSVCPSIRSGDVS